MLLTMSWLDSIAHSARERASIFTMDTSLPVCYAGSLSLLLQCPASKGAGPYHLFLYQVLKLLSTTRLTIMNLFLILYQAIFVASATVETLHPYIPPSFDHAHTGVRVDVRVPLPYDTSYPHPLDGDMVAELRSWGYKDIGDELSELCHFQQHGINQALAALGIDSRSLKEGGPNKCFHITHEDGPTVLPGPNGHSPTNPASQQYIGPDGVQYRVSHI
jgi:hypothetical protein